MQQIKKMLQKWGTQIGIILFLFLAFIAGNSTIFSNHTRPQQVLGIKTHITPFPILSPVPTTAPITVINNIIIPTGIPSHVSPVPTQSPIIVVVTPAPTFSPTETPTPTVSPTPIPQSITVDIDYAGQHATDSYTTAISAEESAWQAIQDAVGVANIHYTDYGGTLGIFITGFNGIDAASNQYYDFQVNGASSNVGVSSYTVQDGDILKFVLTSF